VDVGDVRERRRTNQTKPQFVQLLDRMLAARQRPGGAGPGPRSMSRLRWEACRRPGAAEHGRGDIRDLRKGPLDAAMLLLGSVDAPATSVRRSHR